MLEFPDYPFVFWIAATIAVLIAGLAKGGFGSGMGAASTPIIALTISAAEAAALLLPILMVADAFAVKHYRRWFDKSSLIQLLSGAMVGIALGWFFFGYFRDNEEVLKMGIGILALAFVLFQMMRSVLLGAIVNRQPHPAKGVTLGTLAGFTSTLAHVGGPAVVMHLLPQKMTRQVFVGTSALFFAIVNVVKLVPYGQLGLLRFDNLTAVILLAPLAWLGVKAGVMLNRRFTDLWFNRVIYAGLVLIAIQLIMGRNFVELVF